MAKKRTKAKKGSKAARGKAELARLLKAKAGIEMRIGPALAAAAGLVSPDHATRPPIKTPANPSVAVRMHKQGVVYQLFVNNVPVPHSDSGLHPLPLGPGPNFLRWFVIPSKIPWAFQLDLVVNSGVQPLDRHSSAELPSPKFVHEQQPLLVG